MATVTLPACVASIFSKYTRSPAISTTATAIAQLFLTASARAGAATYFAASRGIGKPYGCGASGDMSSSSLDLESWFFHSLLVSRDGVVDVPDPSVQAGYSSRN